MLWCHLAGLGTTWDAPLSFRRAYKDEDDPEPPTGADVPEQTLAEDHDPDELLGIVHSYAGQVSLLDSCLEAFLEFLKDLKAADQPLLAITSSRGFPLGEHRRVGPCDEALYGELVQVPLLLRFPDGTGAAARSQALVEPADLWATFSEWWQNGPAPASPAAASLIQVVRQDITVIRDRLCIAGRGDQRAIRTPAWYFRAARRRRIVRQARRPLGSQQRIEPLPGSRGIPATSAAPVRTGHPQRNRRRPAALKRRAVARPGIECDS